MKRKRLQQRKKETLFLPGDILSEHTLLLVGTVSFLFERITLSTQTILIHYQLNIQQKDRKRQPKNATSPH